tara:strand:- start:220 stop:759 length:540 start_codon:yes stop_codon:yes gene_type:complete
MENLKFTLFLFVGLLILVSCSKKKEEGCTDRLALNYDQSAEVDNGLCEYEVPVPEPVLSVKDLLCTQTWYLNDIEKADTLSQVTTNTYASKPACEKDNGLTFFQNYTATNDAGSLKCAVSEPQIEFGIWSFGSDQTQITIDLPLTGTVTYTILSITETNLVLTNLDGGDECKLTMRHSL